MTPTDVLRARVRKLLNERIPDGGTDKDTLFLDAEIDELLKEANTIYAAVSMGWTEKAGMLEAEIESYTVGTEKYDLPSLKDRLNYALMMAQKYADMDQAENGGSFLLRVNPPEVL